MRKGRQEKGERRLEDRGKVGGERRGNGRGGKNQSEGEEIK